MRRTLVVLGLVAPLSVLAAAWAGRADALTTPTTSHTATCLSTSYTLTGSFSILSASPTFHLTATAGGCVGTSTGVTVNLDFTTVGPWSCSGGVARAFQGTITPNNGFDQQVDANLVNTGGEYLIELHALNGTLAAGQFTILSTACAQTQTTIGGNGTLTFTA